MSRHLTLLDTRGLMLRAYHGSFDRSFKEKSDGTPMHSWEDGLHKFVEDVVEVVLDNQSPAHDVISCWDGGNEYRRGLFPGYKKSRRDKAEADPLVVEEMKTLEQVCKRLLNYLGVRTVYVPGEECDDLLALLVERLEYDSCVIRTNDGDLTQLVSDKVSVWLSDVFCTAREGNYKGTPYHLVRLHKALLGDSSDSYSGVKGFGPKTFARLATNYGVDALEQLQDALDRNEWAGVEWAAKETQDQDLVKILEHWSEARNCFVLASLNPTCCYGNLKGRKPKKPLWSARVPNRDKVVEILESAGLESKISSFEHLFPVNRLLRFADVNAMPGIAQEILHSPAVSYDYESTDKLKHPAFRQVNKDFVDVLSQELAGISINYGKHLEKTLYLPVDHKDTDSFPKEWVTWLLQTMDARTGPTVVQNASFELTVSQVNLDYMPRAPFDTQIMASYVDENEESHLKGMSLRNLGYTQASYQEVTQGRDMCDLTGEEVLSYGCDDSLVTSWLFVLYRDIMQCEGSWEFYCQNEIEPAVNDALDFIAGTDVDLSLLASQAAASSSQIKDRSKAIRDLLRTHCSPDRAQTQEGYQEAQQAALTLHNEWMTLPLCKLQHDPEGSPEQEEELRDGIWGKAWRGCFYQDRKEEVFVDTFVPTVTQFNRILGILDHGAPKLTRVSGPGIDAFDAEIMDYLALGTTSSKAEPSRINEFAALLYAAKKSLSKRAGPGYPELIQFCQGVLTESRTGKTVVSGDELNMGSGPQMQALLYGKLSLPIRKRSKVTPGSARDIHSLQGSAATGLKAIAAAFVYDMPEGDLWKKDLLLDYKTVATEQQNQSLYFGPYPLWIHPRDGKIHPGIRNCGTVTRRPAGSSPNPLQVSKKGALRKVFVGGRYPNDSEPRIMVSGDVAGQEAAITAVESGDQNMLKIFLANPREDFHSMTSSAFAHMLLPRYGIPAQSVLSYEDFVGGLHGTDEKLRAALSSIRGEYGKQAGFTLLYVGGPITLAESLLINKDLAKDMFDAMLRTYPGLPIWQKATAEKARKQGYIGSVYGTRRHAPTNLWADDNSLRMRAERQMCNFLAQGTAADMLKIARQAIVDRDMRSRYQMRAIAPIYDEFRASVPISLAVNYMEELSAAMSITAPTYPIPMLIELKVGSTWGSQIELGLFDRERAEKLVHEIGEAL